LDCAERTLVSNSAIGFEGICRELRATCHWKGRMHEKGNSCLYAELHFKI